MNRDLLSTFSLILKFVPDVFLEPIQDDDYRHQCEHLTFLSVFPVDDIRNYSFRMKLALQQHSFSSAHMLKEDAMERNRINPDTLDPWWFSNLLNILYVTMV